MANYTLRGGEQINLLTQEELRHELGETTSAWFQEEARGVSRFRFETNGNASGGTLILPPNGERIGPDPGYCWEVQRISVNGLTGSDAIYVHRTIDSGRGLIDMLTATKPAIYPKCILGAGEFLILEGFGLTATGEICLNGEGWELPELDQYKLL